MRCVGQCCRQFYLSEPYDDYRKDYEKWLAWAKDNSKPEPKYQDIHFVFPMLIPLDGQAIDGGWRFTCKHFNRETGDCTVYEHRPQMCRDYPNGKACTYKGCTKTEDE